MAERSNDEVLAELAGELADGIEAALGPWVERSVRQLVVAYAGAIDDSVTERARAAGVAARADVAPRVRALLELDPDEQWTNPLALVRTAVAYPTEVLRETGVPPVVRDAAAEAQFPDDDYDLTPTRFADLDPDLHEPGLAWGAAKAFVVKARHAGRGA